jgi:hypothetical protein
MRVKMLLACSLLAIAVAGCGDDNGNAGSKTQTSSSSKTAQLDGTYSATFSGRESAPGGSNPEPGLWALHVKPPVMQAAYAGKEKTFGFALSDGVPVKVAGKTLTFGSSQLCNGRGSGAKYTYSATAGTLQFKKVGDPCTERALFLTTHAWKRISNDPEASVR